MSSYLVFTGLLTWMTNIEGIKRNQDIMQIMEQLKNTKVIIIGGTGNIGRNLSNLLISNDIEVHILSRKKQLPDKNSLFYHEWNPLKPDFDSKLWENTYAVVNLAGENVSGSAWTVDRKNAIYNSRVINTEILSEFISKNKIRIEKYIGASAIGFYGDRKDELCSVNSTPGDGFLAKVCKDWEKAHSSVPAIHSSIVRIGVVLDRNSGALKEMLQTLPYFIACPGSGMQILSWIHINDLSRIFLHQLQSESMIPIINGVSPSPSSMKEFTETLKQIYKPFAGVIPAPSIALQTILGEMSQIVLHSQNCSNRELLENKFTFTYPTLFEALKQISGH